MVKMKKGDRGRQAWHDTVSQLARETGAAVPGNSPQKRRETRKRVAKQTKAASRWIDDAGLDARDLTAWARVDAMLDAPKTSHLIALDADDSDGGEYREDSHSDVDMDEDERKAARRAKKKDAPKKSRERKAPAKRKKKRNPEEERRRQRHRQRVLSQVLLDDFAPSRGAPAPRGADYVGAAARAPRPARAAPRLRRDGQGREVPRRGDEPVLRQRRRRRAVAGEPAALAAPRQARQRVPRGHAPDPERARGRGGKGDGDGGCAAPELRRLAASPWPEPGGPGPAGLLPGAEVRLGSKIRTYKDIRCRA